MHHLYVVVDGSRPHREHVRFRDHLREHPDAARRYAACKRDLARRDGMDRAAYTEGKSGCIAELLRAAHPPEGV